MEVGGYRELDLRKGNEYFKGMNIARLNSGRAGILYSLRCMDCNKVYMPFYECVSVRDFLGKHGIKMSFYHINERFEPILSKKVDDDTAILIVNYFGIMPKDRMVEYCELYKKIIIDNTQAFFSKPIESAYCVYSARKFFGVPDGAYVIGKRAGYNIESYVQDKSAETSLYLLKRIEDGGNNNYSFYLQNEMRLNDSEVMQMSKLTRALLDNIDYMDCKKRRAKNFVTARKLFDDINNIKITLPDVCDEPPIAYPLIIENEKLRTYLKEWGIYVGQWWKYLLEEMNKEDVEYYFAKYLIPIQIDHRYTEVELEYEKKIVIEGLRKKNVL